MKRTNFKHGNLKMLAIACLATAAVGAIAIQETSANATSTTPYSTLALEDGASVRYATTKEEMGLRFKLTMSKAQYEAINNYYTNVSFGILIAPNDYLSEGHELNAANVFGIGGTQIYGWAEPDGNGGWNEYTGSKVEIVNFSTTELTVSADDANLYEFNGALVDIMGTDTADSTNNIDREFCGKGYMLYTDGTTQKVHIVGDEDNVRSMAYVAQKAIADTTSNKKPTAAQKTTLQELYVDDVESAVKVNYYGLTNDGSYKLLKTETTSAKTQIGETVTLTDMETALESEGYNYVARKSDTSAFVWANEKTELNVYYYQSDLGLIDSQEVAMFDYKTAFPDYTYILQRYTERYKTTSATVSSTEATLTLDMADYLTGEGLLDLTKLDGQYHLIASKGNDINTVSFDAYYSSDGWVWTRITEENIMYARGFQSDTYGNTTNTIAALERADTTNDYFKIAWNEANNITGVGTMVGNNGFSVLSLHSKAYYEKMLKEQPNVQLEFRVTMATAFLDTVDTTKNVLAPNTKEGATQRGMIKTAYKNTDLDYNSSTTPSSTISGSTPITTGSWWRVRIPLTTLLANWEHLHKAHEGTGQAINGRRWQGQLVTWTWNATSNMEHTGGYMSKFEIYVGEFAWYTAA